MSRADGPGPIGKFAVGAACAIFDPRRRVLLVRHTYGRLNWALPGGIVQPNEAPRVGAQRELHEETGLSMTPGRLTGVYYDELHDFGPMLHFVFRIDWSGEQAPVPQPPEISEVGWFSVEALPSPMTLFSERRIRDALADEVAYAVVESRTWR